MARKSTPVRISPLMTRSGAVSVLSSRSAPAVPRGWSSGLDYRHLEFSDARVDFLVPSLEYYFERPAWIRVAYSQSWTRFDDSPEPAGNESFTGNYYHGMANPLLLRLGYAYGNESFTGLSVDRIGNFSAHTYIGGLDIEISQNAEIGMAYAYQDRQDGGFQHSVRLHLRLRR